MIDGYADDNDNYNQGDDGDDKIDCDIILVTLEEISEKALQIFCIFGQMCIYCWYIIIYKRNIRMSSLLVLICL